MLPRAIGIKELPCQTPVAIRAGSIPALSIEKILLIFQEDFFML